MCDSKIEKTTTEDVLSVSRSAKAEFSKLDGLLNELFLSRSLFENKISEFNEVINCKKEILASMDLFIEEEIKNKHESLNKEIDSVQDQIQLIRFNLSSYESLEYLELQKEKLELSLGSEPAKKRVFESLSDTGLTEITMSMFNFLELWGYPKISSVLYSERKKDFILSGEDRNLAGKGFRAISYSSFLLSLMEYSKSRDYKFGFCMIDSPLVTYRKPDVPEGEAISEDMALSFYKSLGLLGDDYQVIIIENEDVPRYLESKVNHIHFTRNFSVGRYGFIPQKHI